jgi:hypothetical protein
MANNNLDKKVAVMQNDIESMKKMLEKNEVFQDNLIELLERKFVTKDQFKPVKAIVYGAVGIILTTVFIALLALVVIQI